MHVKKPEPLPLGETKPPRLCAVCGQVSYSLGGVHPQCAQEQADAGRLARIKAEKKAELRDKPRASPTTRPWYKSCPKCRLQMHIRKKACECGYRFR
ncbi:MAG: hypothetical protein HY290_23490 [Planctomycetia bacterium]|nr:hypothetical protein [Planctomycetia bacterium]